MAPRAHKSSAKTKILDAALIVIRANGYAATTVDDLCAASNVAKGAFFSPRQEQGAIRAACEASIGWHAEKTETDIVEALRQRGGGSDLDRKKPSTAHANGPPGCVHVGQGKGRREDRRSQH